MLAKVYKLTAPHQLIIEEQEISALAENEVLAETVYSAISPGTELAAWRGDPPLRPMKVYPRVNGYCSVAKVIEKGAGVNTVEVGDYILTQQSHRTAYKIPVSDILLKFKEGEADPALVTTTYLYHLGYMALQTAGYFPGMFVAVIGIGTLGYTTAALLKAFGCEPFLFTSQQALKDFLKEDNFRFILDKSENSLETVKNVTGVGVDVVINTTNAWEDYEMGMQLARYRGHLVHLGFPGRTQPQPHFNPLDSKYFYDKQLTIQSCGYVTEIDVPPHDVRFNLKRNMTYLYSLIKNGNINPSRLISFNTKWDNLEGAYKKLLERDKPAFTAVLEWKN